MSYMRKRQNPPPSQAEAARKSGMSRETWNRLERGQRLPHPSNIPAIAKTLRTDVARLYARAHYAVPRDLQFDGRKERIEKLVAYWDEATSTAEFMMSVLELWQNEHQQDKSNRYIILDKPFAQILMLIDENFTRTQQLRLAAALIQRSPVKKLRKHRLQACDVLDLIDSQLERNKWKVLFPPDHAHPRFPLRIYEVGPTPTTMEYHIIISNKELLMRLIEAGNNYWTRESTAISR